MGIEQGKFNMEPRLPRADHVAFSYLLEELTSLDFGLRNLYAETERVGQACFDAVNTWKKMNNNFPEFSFDTQWFLFEKYFPSAVRYASEQSGQAMLKIEPLGAKNQNVLIVDVGAYLYGFTYDEMFVAVGSWDFITQKATETYRTKYPDIVVKPYLKR